MKIELQFNSVTIQPQDIQEIFPNIISSIGPYPEIHKTPKRRKQRSKKTMGSLIAEIIDSIEK